MIETSDSVTAVPRIRRSDEMRRTPCLVWVASFEQPAPPAANRIITFKNGVVIGRREPSTREEGIVAWVVRDRMMSANHASITLADHGWEVTDLGSTNGTVADGVVAQPKVKLRDGSLLFIGGNAIVFRLLTESEMNAVLAELDRPLGPVPTCQPEFALKCGMLRKLSETDGEVLLTGETGVGKEVYANAIHHASGRKGKFVAINCAALPRELVESELFGYLRGAHSQAVASKQGIIEEAEGGTLFLDEIGDMAPELQTKLLRFTQDRLLIPVGGTRSRRIDVRILAATSRTAPPTAGGAGLRQDLAARLGAEPIRIPPLKERMEDLGVLISYILGARIRPFEPMALQALCLHTWPGNVRELEKVLTTAEALARGSERISLEHLPQAIAAGPWRIKSAPAGRATRPPPTALELEDLMRRFKGNMQRVARELDRKPALIYRWAKRFNLNVDSYRDKEE